MPDRVVAASADHASWVARYAAGESVRSIATAAGRSSNTVSSALIASGVTLRPAGPAPSRIPSAQEITAAGTAYENGASLAAVASLLGVSRSYAQRLLASNGTASRRVVLKTPRRIDVPISALISAYEQGASIRELAAQFGISDFTVNMRLREAGIARRPFGGSPPRAFEGARLDDLVAQYRAGKTIAELARASGNSPKTVRDALRRAGVELRANLSARLNLPNETLLAEHLAGATRSALAAKYGVAETTITRRLNAAGVHGRHRRPNAALAS